MMLLIKDICPTGSKRGVPQNCPYKAWPLESHNYGGGFYFEYFYGKRVTIEG